MDDIGLLRQPIGKLAASFTLGIVISVAEEFPSVKAHLLKLTENLAGEHCLVGLVFKFLAGWTMLVIAKLVVLPSVFAVSIGHFGVLRVIAGQRVRVES